MKRKEYLESAMTEEKNVATVVSTTLKKDAKVLSKAKRDLEDDLDEAEEVLEERLSSNVTLDKSVIEVLFAKIQDLKSTLALYKEFEKTYLTSAE
jgi:hypothetical protein